MSPTPIAPFLKKQFYDFLHRLIDAGFENRIMTGSDEEVWPDAVSDCAEYDPEDRSPLFPRA